MSGGNADLDEVNDGISIWNVPRSEVQTQIKLYINSAFFKAEAKQGLRFFHVSLLNCGNFTKLLCSRYGQETKPLSLKSDPDL